MSPEQKESTVSRETLSVPLKAKQPYQQQFTRLEPDRCYHFRAQSERKLKLELALKLALRSCLLLEQ